MLITKYEYIKKAIPVADSIGATSSEDMEFTFELEKCHHVFVLFVIANCFQLLFSVFSSVAFSWAFLWPTKTLCHDSMDSRFYLVVSKLAKAAWLANKAMEACLSKIAWHKGMRLYLRCA